MIRPKGGQRSRKTDSVAWSDYGGAVSDLAYGDGEYPQPAHNPCGSGGCAGSRKHGAVIAASGRRESNQGEAIGSGQSPATWWRSSAKASDLAKFKVLFWGNFFTTWREHRKVVLHHCYTGEVSLLNGGDNLGGIAGLGSNAYKKSPGAGGSRDDLEACGGLGSRSRWNAAVIAAALV
jgi:hypothetical protein